MSAPLVTAIATSFNHARFVEECLDSILAQDYPNLQLIVMDDASSDGSVAAIERWVERTGTECELVVNEQNAGIVRTRNDAISRAKGKYVATVAADDLWLPGKVAMQVEMLERRPEAAVAYSDALQIDADGAPLAETYIEMCRRSGIDGHIYEELLDVDFIPAPTTMMRRSCLEAVGPYEEALSFETWDMLLRLARRYEFAFCPTITAKKRALPVSAPNLIGSRFWHSVVDVQRRNLGHSPEWDAFLVRRSAVQAYGWHHPNARAYLREAVRLLGWRDEVAFYYLLEIFRVPPIALAYIFPVRAMPRRTAKRLARMVARPLRRCK